ncbi:MAG TPA: class A beta-lactamase [Gemmatimonadaceae bacterium]|nr:class A beta-lactamase [Gemmatimonadaceae bacterium]
MRRGTGGVIAGIVLGVAACSDRGSETIDSARVPARAASLDSLERRIAAVADSIDGSVGFAAVHIPSGARLSHNGDRRYPLRSVYKLPIGLSVLRRVDAGELRLDSAITVTEADYAPNHSPLRDRAGGKPATVTVDSLLVLTIEQSDNTASDVLLRLAGGPAATMRDMQSLGLGDVRVDRTERELGSARDSDDDERDTATPNAMADFLVVIQQGTGLSRASHRRLLEIMQRTRTGPNRIRGLLPPNTPVAHKTGTARPMTNDAGVVTLPDGRGYVAIAVFVRSTAGAPAARERVIAEIAREVYDYFSAPN